MWLALADKAINLKSTSNHIMKALPTASRILSSLECSDKVGGMKNQRREVVKSLVRTLTMVVLAMSVGCGEKAGPSKAEKSQGGQALDSSVSEASVSGIPLTEQQVNTPVTTLDKEAAKQALDRWKPSKLGQSYYVICVNTVKTVYELQKLRVQLQPSPLSEADKLNGYEWRGVIVLSADAVRSYCPQRRDGFGKSSPPDTTWSQWINETMPFSFIAAKTNGKWSLEDPSSMLTSTPNLFEQVEASDLPK
jgi:hypothetical protein